MGINDNNEYKIRARLIVKGFVQGVGYRNIVMRHAWKLNILGIVRNLNNGDVEIFCKCKNSNHLEEFINKITIRDDKENVYLPFVEIIEKYITPKEIDSFNPPKIFSKFSIDYGDIPSQDKEVLIKMDTGSSIMLQTSSNVKNMNTNMCQSFDRIDKKYDSFGKELKAVHNDLKVMSDCFRELVEYYIKQKALHTNGGIYVQNTNLHIN